jgi:PAS domain S-box-containing protein
VRTPDFETLELLPTPVWLGKPDGTCLFANSALLRLVGLDIRDVVDHSWESLVAPEARAEIRSYLDATLQSAPTFSFRAWLNNPRLRRLARIDGKILREPDGTPALLSVTLTDLTYTYRTSKRRRLRAEQTRVCFEYSPIGIMFVDANLLILRANNTCASILNTPLEHLEGRPLAHLLTHPTTAELSQQVLTLSPKTLATGTPHNLQGWAIGDLQTAEGTQFIDWEIRRVDTAEGEAAGLLMVISDVTQKKLAEHALQQSDELRRLAAAAAQVGTFIYEPASQRHRWSPELRDLYGIPSDEKNPVGPWPYQLHPDDAAEVLPKVVEALTPGGSGLLDIETRILRFDGSTRWVILKSTTQFDDSSPDHAPLRTIGVMVDITARRNAEEEVRRLAAVMENSSDFVIVTSPSGQIIYLNSAAHSLLGLEDDANPTHLHIRDIIPPDDYQTFIQKAVPCCVKNTNWEGEGSIKRHDGNLLQVSQLVSAQTDASGRIEFLSLTLRDVSERKRIEQNQREWAARYEAAVMATGQVLFDWDTITDDVTFGGHPEKVFGHTIEDLGNRGDRFRSMIHLGDIDRVNQTLQSTVAVGLPLDLKFRFTHKDGSFVHVHSVGFFLPDASGEKRRMIGFLHDITSEQESREAIIRAQETLEQRVNERTAELSEATGQLQTKAVRQEAIARIGALALDGTPLNLLFHQAVELIRDVLTVDFVSVRELSEDQRHLLLLASTGWPEHLHDQQIPAGLLSQPGYAVTSNQTIIVNEIASETRFSPSRPVAATGVKSGISVVLSNDKSPFGVLTAFSLSPRQFSRDDSLFLQSLANVLSGAIFRKKSEEQLREARSRAEQASRAKSDFLSRMSHELRTPLNAVLGFAQLLRFGANHPKQIESIDHISKAGEHLLSLINEVLDIARIEAGGMSVQPIPIPLPPFLLETAELLRPLADRHYVRIRIHSHETPTPTAFADRQRLKQVLINLLSNAIKYNRPEGDVSVSTQRNPDSKTVLITIRDSGFGIPESKMHRIFSAFDRLDAETQGIEGSGIGLALTKGLIEAMNGSITVQSEENIGSTFTVTLPEADPVALPHPDSAPPQENTEAPPIEPTPATPSLLLLVLDPDAARIRSLERILTRRPSYDIASTHQPHLALRLAEQRPPNLLLLNPATPALHLNDFLNQIRALPQLANLPVLLLPPSEHPIPESPPPENTALIAFPSDSRSLLEKIDALLNPERRFFS